MTILDLPTPLEQHDGVTVKRDDLINPYVSSGKLRGVLPYLQALAHGDGVTTVVNAGASHSNSHAIVAYAGQAAGLIVHTVTNTDRMHPGLIAATEFGATVHLTRPSHLGPLRATAARLADDLGATLLPWAFLHPAVADCIGQAVREVPPGYTHVVPVGSGAYLNGILAGLAALRRDDPVIAVASMGLRPSTRGRIVVPPGVPFTLLDARKPVATPWPSDPHYEWPAWPVARSLADLGEEVLFWSVGRPAT